MVWSKDQLNAHRKNSFAKVSKNLCTSIYRSENIIISLDHRNNYIHWKKI